MAFPSETTVFYRNPWAAGVWGVWLSIGTAAVVVAFVLNAQGIAGGAGVGMVGGLVCCGIGVRSFRRQRAVIALELGQTAITFRTISPAVSLPYTAVHGISARLLRHGFAPWLHERVYFVHTSAMEGEFMVGREVAAHEVAVRDLASRAGVTEVQQLPEM